MGKGLVVSGLILVSLGLLTLVAERVGFRFGRLPGDLQIHWKNGVIYIPIVTCLVASLVLSLITWLVRTR